MSQFVEHELIGGIEFCRLHPDRERISSASGVWEVIRAFNDLPREDRQECIHQLHANFCMECGSDSPRCQCWNDE